MRPIDRLSEALPADAARWLSGSELDAHGAWEQCPDAGWLMRMATAVGVSRSKLVEAALALAQAARDVAELADPPSTRAIDVARRWLNGAASSSEAWAAGFAASEAAEAVWQNATADAMQAAACVAFACDDQADDAFYGHRAYAARAVEHATAAMGDAAAPAAADHVRRHIPTALFLSAFAVASKPPPPLEPAEVEPATDSFYT